MPFTLEQFISVFRQYNEAVFPMQVILNLLGLLAIYLLVKKSPFTGRFITVLLSFLWIWMGIAYHLVFFSTINKAAIIFGILFILQGGFFLVEAFSGSRPEYKLHRDSKGITGAILIAYSLIGYPLLAFTMGHKYPAMPTFGLPCPTTIFTFGLMLLYHGKNKLRLLLIPLLWTIPGTTAIFLFGMREDSGLLISGLVTVIFLLPEKRIQHEKMV